MSTTFIYTLICPFTGAPRYVGKSDRPVFRAAAHIRRAKAGKENHTRKSRWISALLALGLEPILQVVSEVPREDWKSAERGYIQRLQENGWDLVNGTEGGDGGALTGEALKSMSEAQRGKKQSLETIQKRVAKTRGKKRTPEQCQKHSNYKRGYWASLSVEERASQCARMRSFKKI